MRESGRYFDKFPSIDQKQVDLYRLYCVIQQYGGYSAVREQWEQVAQTMGFFDCPSKTGVTLHKHYDHYVLPFEEQLLQEFPV